MHHRYESQPFQVVRQINNFSPVNRGNGLRERTDYNNLPINYQSGNEKLGVEQIKKPSLSENEVVTEKNRTSYLNAPIRKIW